MTAKEKYASVLMEVFMIGEGEVESASTQTLSSWDSVGKLNLVVGLEDAFGIELDADDIISLNSYEDGLKILRKYNIEL